MAYSEVKSSYIHGNLVLQDGVYKYRLYDAWGPDVVKYDNHFVGQHISVTNTPDGWAMTAVGTSPITITDGAGGLLLLTTGGTEDNGVQIQLVNEAFLLASGYPCYFGCRLKIDSATESDFIAGLCIRDTTLLDGMTHGVYFRKIDGSTDVYFVLEEGSAESTGVVHTMTTDYVTLEWYYDGTSIDSYVNGVLQTRLATTYLPDTVEMTPSLALLTGDNAAVAMTVDWIRVIQINA